MKKLVKKPWFITAIALLSIANIFFAFKGTHIKSPLEQQFGIASNKLKNSTPGNQRAEVFLQELKKIDVSNAPADQQQALKQYISAMEASVSDSTMGHDANLSDKALAVAARNLAKSFHQ